MKTYDEMYPDEAPICSPRCEAIKWNEYISDFNEILFEI